MLLHISRVISSLQAINFFFHCTCVTSNRTRCPVAERGHDTVFLAGQLTWSHCAGARAVWTPRQQKHTQRGCRLTLLGTLYTFTKPQRVVWKKEKPGGTHPSHSSYYDWILGKYQTRRKLLVPPPRFFGLRIVYGPDKTWINGLDFRSFFWFHHPKSQSGVAEGSCDVALYAQMKFWCWLWALYHLQEATI